MAEGESIDSALGRFLAAVEKDHGRRWYKRRYGYYESPSALRRKRRKMWRLCGAGPKYAYAGHPYSRVHPPTHPCIGDDALFARTGPTNAAAR